MAQVVRNRHALQLGLAGLDLQRRFVQRHVQRQGRAVAPFLQRVGLHHVVGQHGDFVARHVDGGQARAAQYIDGAAGLHGQAGRSNVDADGDRAAAQALQAQRIVNFRGL